jgi:uncharacterized protein YodC (DUF2158 family)
MQVSKPGDLVVLKSGGPIMTLGRKSYEYDKSVASLDLYRCHWFEGDFPQSADFFEEELVAYTPVDKDEEI